MKLYLIRHGQTDWNLEHRAQGLVDNPLNETGIRQAEELRERLRAYDFDVCYCSPLKRALKTAEIAVNKRTKIIRDNDLIERSFGNLEGTDANTWKIDIYDRKLNADEEGIEPINSVIARSKRALDRIISENPPDAEILVVGHEAFFRAMHYNIVGYDENTDFHNFYLKNCEIASYNIPL